MEAHFDRGLPAALDPAGPFAAPLAAVSWFSLAIGAAVFALVLAALGAALTRNKWRRRLGRESAVVIGGVIAPVVTLTAMLTYGLATTARLAAPPDPADLRIRVVGEMWWWRVFYLDEPAFETANEIMIPVGRSVTIELQSADVIHSFWAPRLSRKLDMIPGRRNVLRLEADAPGVYRGRCTEYCGAGHALMAFEVIAVEAADFARWAAAQAPPADIGGQAEGLALFDRAGCGACHAIRGTRANGAYGPDLTHVASRRTLAAGILPNNRATLRAWIEDADALKPGARMPSYERLEPRELDALVRLLEGLQ